MVFHIDINVMINHRFAGAGKDSNIMIFNKAALLLFQLLERKNLITAVRGLRPSAVIKCEANIVKFVEFYNHQRHHESLSNLALVDVYFGRSESILENRRMMKEKTIQSRRLKNQLESV